MKKYRKYELIYLIQSEATDEERQKIHDRVEHVIEEGEAWLISREDWGKRKLAYEINKQNKAYYSYLTFVAAPGLTAEIERVLRMQDNCIRFITIRLEDNITEDRIPAMIAPSTPEASPEASEEVSNG